MRVAIFTANAIRHKYVANTLAENADDVLVVSECKKTDAVDIKKSTTAPLIEEHFRLRYKTEKEFFASHDFFMSKTLPVLYKEVNRPCVYNAVKEFKPDLMFVFGASILKEPILSLLPPGRFINLHLGLSPYYRGSGTNFWPFVNEELEYVGATILHIDAGIDTGDIIAHVVPNIETRDNVHIVGCKVIRDSAACLLKVTNMVKNGKELNRVRQWQIKNGKYYEEKDFNESALLRYKNNLSNGMVERYLQSPKKIIKLVSLYER